MVVLADLEKHLDPSSYGKGQAKSWESLLEEVSSGECRIELIGNTLIRVIEVVSIDVRVVLNGRVLRLFEAYQEFADGRKRERKLWGVSEKRKPNEDLGDAVLRAMREELGLNPSEYLFQVEMEPEIEEKESPSYPGLLSRYVRYRASVQLEASAFRPDGFIEVQPDKKTVFVWRQA